MTSNDNILTQSSQLKLLSDIKSLRVKRKLIQQRNVVSQQQALIEKNESETREVEAQRADLFKSRPSDAPLSSAWIQAEKKLDLQLCKQIEQLEKDRKDSLLVLKEQEDVFAECVRKFREQQVKDEYLTTMLHNKRAAHTQQALQQAQAIQDEEFIGKTDNGY